MPLRPLLLLVTTALASACGSSATTDTGQTSASTGGASGGTTSAGGSSAAAGGGSGAAGASQAGAGGATTGAAWTPCAAPGDCLLLDADCCGFCGLAMPSNYDAVDFTKVDAQKAASCMTGSMGCPPHCAPQKNPDLAAFCKPPPMCNSGGCDGKPGTCAVIEVHLDDVSACQTDADCVIRKADCCDCGPTMPSDLVALNGMLGGYYEKQVCGPGVGGCKENCAPQHPAGYSATCNTTTHHCEVKAPG